MQIVGAFNLAHGTSPLDPQTRDTSKFLASKSSTKEEAIRIHNAMRKTAAALVKAAPDLIIMTTPHGLKVTNNYIIYNNEWAEGSAEWDGIWSDYTAKIKIDNEVSDYLLRELPKTGNKVEEIIIGLPKYCPTEPLPLRWAEVVPWWFIADEAKKANFTMPKAVIISLPFKIIDTKSVGITAATKLGWDLYEVLNNADFLKSKKVAFVTSIDLSHNHSKCATSPYPYLSTCNEFDTHQLNWAKLDVNAANLAKGDDELLVKAGALVDKNVCCGYTGLVMIQGLFKRAVAAGLEFKATFVDYAVPTYFGMFCSYFLPK